MVRRQVAIVGDDIFMTFDDARTKNGILALAAVGKALQPILFTHHEYAVDLARETLRFGMRGVVAEEGLEPPTRGFSD